MRFEISQVAFIDVIPFIKLWIVEELDQPEKELVVKRLGGPLLSTMAVTSVPQLMHRLVKLVMSNMMPSRVV